MNKFLRLMEITFRRDPTNYRPRINKHNSQLDQEQKHAGNYFLMDDDKLTKEEEEEAKKLKEFSEKSSKKEAKQEKGEKGGKQEKGEKAGKKGGKKDKDN